MTRAAVAATTELQPATVLMVANYAPDVGFAWWLMESFWVEISRVAERAGMAALLTYPETGAVPASIRDSRIETVVRQFPGSGAVELWRAVRLVRERRIRVVYFTDRGFTSFSYAALRVAGVRRIVVHDHTPGDRPPIRGVRGFVKALWRRLPFLNADLLVAVSPLIRERAISNARIPAGKTTVVQNGIKPIRCDEGRDYIRQELGIPSDAAICITIARADRYKRIDFAIEVARRVVREQGRHDIVFVFCGDGPEMSALRELASAAELGRHFIFAGRRSDVRELLCGADLALHPSRGEAFSLAIVEYMSAGAVLMVPDIPSVCQAVRHGESGLVYPDGDAKAATELVCRLLDSPVERRRMSACASRTVESEFSSRAMHEQLNVTMHEVIGQLST